MSRKYQYTARCTYCERQFPTRLRPPEGPLSCGVGECTRQHNDAVAAWHEQASKARAGRQPRQTRVVMSEWGMAAMLSRPRNTKPSTKGEIMSNWAVGHNLAGYLPEADVAVFAGWADAWQALQDEMREYADADDESALHTMELLPADAAEQEDDYPSMLATVESILRDDPAVPDREWAATVEDGSGRPIVFWLNATDEPPSEESRD